MVILGLLFLIGGFFYAPLWFLALICLLAASGQQRYR